MAQASDIVNVNITVASANPTLDNFGTAMLVAYHTAWADRVRTYSSTAAMLTDGFVATDSAYKMAAVAFAQSPAPSKVKIGRKALPSTQVVTLTLTSAVAGDVYKISVNGNALTRTVPGSSTTSAEATAVAALITALTSAVSGVTVVASAAVITATATAAGKLTEFSAWSQNIQIRTTNADPGIATDLAAIFAVDTDWFGFAIDSRSKAEITAASAWAETNHRMLFGSTSDWDVVDPSNTTTDIGSVLKALSPRYTGLWWSGQTNLAHVGPAFMGVFFSQQPGAATGAFKTLTSVPADNLTTLTATQQTALTAKNVNSYSLIQGLNLTFSACTPAGGFLDTTRGIDWLASVIKVAILALLANSAKVPFTDAGGDQIYSAVDAQLKAGVRVGLLAASPAPAVTVPKVATVSSTDRAARNMPGVTFTAQLAGAVHTTTIAGNVAA